MKRQTIVFGLCCALVSWSAASALGPVKKTVLAQASAVDDTPPIPIVPVFVTNVPAVQSIEGSVAVTNLPDVQTVGGTVTVSNLPAVQTVGGTVNVENLPAVQAVGGSVAVTNLPFGVDGGLRISTPGARFVGITSTPVLGSAGWKTLNLACDSQFGGDYPTIRMCTSRDILGTPVSRWPELPGDAWVQPVIVSAGFDGGDGGFVELSGISIFSPGDLSCNGWSGTGIAPGSFRGTGLVLRSNGGFWLGSCTDATILVTCCADTTS